MSSSLMEYEGYHAKIEFDQEDQIFVGHVLGINDSINFHGQSVQELTIEFHNSVNNYVDHCDQIGKDFRHISEMEKIFDKVLQTQSAFEKAIEEYRELQPEIDKLEAYYSGKQWKDDHAMDERGEIPADVKRGVLSEDGIYNMLERNKEIMEMMEMMNCKS